MGAEWGAKELEYYLGFLEFKEDGEPYSLVRSVADSDGPLTADQPKELPTEHEDGPPISQLDVLRRHLSKGSNYVVVFAHDWRHDARIGDDNVADLRHYTAHVARFLNERCKMEQRYCDTKVTGVYIGWRGARVDEPKLKHYFGRVVGGYLGTFAASTTLFDRKAVSERVAPGAISAIRALEETLSPIGGDGRPKPKAATNKMIVFGEGLGANIFASGLKGELIKLVRRHSPGRHLPSALGDLVVLINPASEASNWTDVQREVWNRIAFNTNGETPIDQVSADHQYFPVDQKPVVLSVTAGPAFPASGLRDGDCEWLTLDVNDRHKSEREMLRKNISKSEAMFADRIDYDWITHDLFPVFKLDLGPIAQTFDRWSARIEGRLPLSQSCKETYRRGLATSLQSAPLRLLSELALDLPFQNSNPEYSRTIGNLDPPRSVAGTLAQIPNSTVPFGITHVISGKPERETDQYHSYSTLADANIQCPPANHWLTRARLNPSLRNGMFWDSDQLAPPASDALNERPPAARFVHGFNPDGTAAITRANDPLWNMRAFDHAFARRDGYRLTSFICAMNQLVMDDITQPEQKLDTPAPKDGESAPLKSEAAEPKTAAADAPTSTLRLKAPESKVKKITAEPRRTASATTQSAAALAAPALATTANSPLKMNVAKFLIAKPKDGSSNARRAMFEGPTRTSFIATKREVATRRISKPPFARKMDSIPAVAKPASTKSKPVKTRGASRAQPDVETPQGNRFVRPLGHSDDQIVAQGIDARRRRTRSSIDPYAREAPGTGHQDLLLAMIARVRELSLRSTTSLRPTPTSMARARDVRLRSRMSRPTLSIPMITFRMRNQSFADTRTGAVAWTSPR